MPDEKQTEVDAATSPGIQRAVVWSREVRAGWTEIWVADARFAPSAEILEPIRSATSPRKAAEAVNKVYGTIPEVEREFAQAYALELAMGRFFIAPKWVTEKTLADGSKCGPGLVVSLKDENGRTRRTEDAVALGNKLGFSKHGFTVTVADVLYGVIGGGPIAALADEPAASIADSVEELERRTALASTRLDIASDRLMQLEVARVERERAMEREQTDQEHGRTGHLFTVRTALTEYGLRISWQTQPGSENAHIVGYRSDGGAFPAQLTDAHGNHSGFTGQQVVDTKGNGSVVLRLTEGREFTFTFAVLKASVFGTTKVVDQIRFLLTIPLKTNEEARERGIAKLRWALEQFTALPTPSVPRKESRNDAVAEVMAKELQRLKELGKIQDMFNAQRTAIEQNDQLTESEKSDRMMDIEDAMSRVREKLNNE